MKREGDIKSLDFFIDYLRSLELSIEECYSFLVKMWFISENNIKIPDNIEQLSFYEILDSTDFALVKLIGKIEYHKVSGVKVDRTFLQGLLNELQSYTILSLFEKLTDLPQKKSKGQYFTDTALVEQISSKIIGNHSRSDSFSVIDLASGLGDFLKPFLEYKNALIYAVELDPLSYEIMIFGYLFNPSLELERKSKMILTIKQGDAIKGYSKDALRIFARQYNILSDISKLTDLRDKILNINYSFNLIDLINYFDFYENLKSKYGDMYQLLFWYVEFPELFFDRKSITNQIPGVDLVIGNPPWIYYKNFMSTKQTTNLKKTLPFSKYIFGKYNFALPFLLLAYHLTAKSGGLVLPLGILTETYAKRIREQLFRDQSISEISLLKNSWFKHVVNEYCVIFWNKEEKAEEFLLKNENNGSIVNIKQKHIKSPNYKIPTLPTTLMEEILRLRCLSKLSDVCTIRRGLTLTVEYQKKYPTLQSKSFAKAGYKKLIRHNKLQKEVKSGVFNFQIFQSNEMFFYDKELLGAPGTELLFENPKIIRRNRGKMWYIGLDTGGDFYVNDIFDVIIPIEDFAPLELIFGYLCSSFIQLLTESYLQRDITSNIVRELPFPNFSVENIQKIVTIVKDWLHTKQTFEDFRQLRATIDKIISDELNFSSELEIYLKNNVSIRWRTID